MRGSWPVCLAIGITHAFAQIAYIPNAGSNDLSVISLATNSVAASIALDGAPTGIAIAPDGSAIYVTSASSNRLTVILTSTNSIVGRITVGNGPYGVAVTPNGCKVYVASQDGTISVITPAVHFLPGAQKHPGSCTPVRGVAPGALPNITNIQIPSAHYGLAVSPDGTRVYVQGGKNGSGIAVIDTSSDTIIDSFGDPASGPFGMALSPDGSILYLANLIAGTLSVISTVNDSVTATIPVGSFPAGVAVTPNGSKVYVTNGIDNTVSVISTASNSVVNTVPVGVDPFGASVTPDGSTVYVSNAISGTISVIATATDSVTSTVAVGVNPFALGGFITPAGATHMPPGTQTLADVHRAVSLSAVQVDAPRPRDPATVPVLSFWSYVLLAGALVWVGGRFLRYAQTRA